MSRTLPEIFRAGVAEYERQQAEEHARKIEAALAAIRSRPQDPKPYLRLARLHEEAGRIAPAIEILERGISQCPTAADLWESYVCALLKGNRTAEGIAAAGEAMRLFPQLLIFRLAHALALPILYETEQEIDHYRQRYGAGLEELIATTRLDEPEAARRAFEAIGGFVPFYLAYQGRNDRELQRLYGGWLHRIAAANWPEWATKRPMPPYEGKTRVGYVSRHFYTHSVCKSHFGWIKEHDRTRFEVYCYYLGEESDGMTAEARAASSVFRHLGGDFADAAQAIAADHLHVLVYLDIGMDPTAGQLAALRLAPVQCVTWGHPVTSGLPTLDYFLSSELMEPEDGAEHYTESLVRLSALGVCYRKPVIPRPLLTKTRRDYGLREDSAVFLCCQSVFKYLPQHDDVPAQIALRVPDAQFVFLAPNELLAKALKTRLEKAFRQIGMEPEGRIVVSPQRYTLDYWNLNLAADVYLDSLEWSGFNTTMEAIACGLPVVTAPGKFMRGRHTAAILTQMEVADTVARTKEEYVGMAARLATDAAWRAEIQARMAAGERRIYWTVEPVQALEEFYEQTVGAAGKR